MVSDQPGDQKGECDRPFREHGTDKEEADKDPVLPCPLLLGTDLFEDDPPDEEDKRGKHHVSTHQCGQPRNVRVQPKCPSGEECPNIVAKKYFAGPPELSQ